MLSTNQAAVQLAVNDVCPSSASLGTINGIALSMSAATRAIIPGLFTGIYAVGVKHHVLGGQLAWVVMIGCVT